MPWILRRRKYRECLWYSDGSRLQSLVEPVAIFKSNGWCRDRTQNWPHTAPGEPDSKWHEKPWIFVGYMLQTHFPDQSVPVWFIRKVPRPEIWAHLVFLRLLGISDLKWMSDKGEQLSILEVVIVILISSYICETPNSAIVSFLQFQGSTGNQIRC